MQKQTPDHILAAQGGKKKGCSDPTHSKQDILFICLKSSCNESRLICAQCIQQNTHGHPQNWAEVQELMALNAKDKTQNVTNWPQNKNIRAIFTNSVMADEGNPDLILMEQILEDFIDKIKHQVDQIKKDIKNTIIQQQKTSKELLDYFKNMIGASFDLSPIQDQVIKFKNFQINIQELNHNIRQFTQECQEKEKDILKDYKQQIRDKKLQQLNIKGLQKSLESINKEIQVLQMKALQQISCSDIELEGWQKNQVKMTGNNIYSCQGQTYNIMRSKQTFDRQQLINFKFKLLDYDSFYFYFGLAPINEQFLNQQYFGFQGGPQLCLKTISQRQGTFECDGKDITEVFEPNQTYEVTFCVQEKIFTISDENQQSVMTYTGIWDSSKEWKIVLGPNQNTPIKIQII